MLLVSAVWLAAIFGFAGQASAGPPSWCVEQNVDRSSDHDVSRSLKKDDPVWTLFYLVNATCGKDTDIDSHRGELEAARQYWNQELDMTDADWADVAVWSGASQAERYGTAMTRVLDKVAWSKIDAVDQYMTIPNLRDETEYYVDAMGSSLSELGRMAYIQRCIHSNDQKEVMWALCAADIATFDPKKVAAELHTDKSHTGFHRTVIRMELLKLRGELVEHDKRVKELVAKDETFGKMFDLAMTAAKDWDTKASARAPLLQLVFAMDEGRVTNSRKAFDGCDEKTWAAWTAAVGKISAKSFENMHTSNDGKRFIDMAMGPIVGDPDAYLAGMAMALCAASNERGDHLTQELNSLTYTPGFRGPRNSALMAIAGAGLKFDDRSFTLRLPEPRHEWLRSAHASMNDSGQGVVGSVKADGKKLHVTFQAKMEKVNHCKNWVQTNRLLRIDSGGQLIYAERCTSSEMITINTASKPVDVDSRYAAGLKPGVYTEVYGTTANAVWDKASSTAPSVVFGAPVK